MDPQMVVVLGVPFLRLYLWSGMMLKKWSRYQEASMRKNHFRMSERVQLFIGFRRATHGIIFHTFAR